MCTDSQSLLAALAKGPCRQTGEIEATIWDQLLTLTKRQLKLVLQFVYCHCSVGRNEQVDEAAKSAMLLPQHRAE